MISKNYKQRYYILLKQFGGYNDDLDLINPSLRRIFIFLYKHTEIDSLNMVSEVILYHYIRIQARENLYENVSFYQSVKDIKLFVSYLKRCHDIELPNFDISTLNYDLWLSI